MVEFLRQNERFLESELIITCWLIVFYLYVQSVCLSFRKNKYLCALIFEK